MWLQFNIHTFMIKNFHQTRNKIDFPESLRVAHIKYIGEKVNVFPEEWRTKEMPTAPQQYHFYSASYIGPSQSII